MNLNVVSSGIAAVVAALSLYISPLAAQESEFPYPFTNYDEPYRSQFHFSPRGGWMNDVNGVWYYKGVYYLTYQHYPHGLAWARMHWGAATSADMMHWKQEPVALEPDVNVPGDCYSGSVVVDAANTSGFKTGSEDVFVAIYTATKKGTCLAYSNDKGKTWRAYEGNPVAIGVTDYRTRDPHVFRHPATDRWVCLEYESGTVIYTSPDLKNWTKQSSFNFGYECPDIFELAVDGGPEKKWVVMDASSSYRIGAFDGSVFTPDAGGLLKMDQCDDFYASQTFFRNNFPDNRVIQMAWIRGTLGTSPWTHEASFPCEIKLKTFPDGVRVTRFPIAEISGLYGSSRHWENQQLSPGDNPLSAIQSNCFDLSAEFDLTGATATTIDFVFPNKTVRYDIANAKLLGQSLKPVNNRVKIRLLVDRGVLEAFGNDGLFSWTQSVQFTPGAGSIRLSVNGGVTLVSMDFHAIKRIWPDSPATPDFKTNLTGSWTFLGGAWADIATGKQGNGAGNAFCLNSHNDCNFTYEGDVSLLLGDAAGLVFRANADTTAGYCATIESAGMVRLRALGRGELARYITPVQAGPAAHHLKVAAVKSNIKVYFDTGTAPVIDYTDTIPPDSGGFGLNVYKGSAVFQNIHAAGLTPGGVAGKPNEAKKVTLEIEPRRGPGARIRIRYTVPGSVSSFVSMELFDLRGRLVRTLVRGVSAPGGTVDFDWKNERGGPLSAGNYFLLFRVNTPATTVESSARMLLLP